MKLRELLIKNRSFRRFVNEETIEPAVLREIVENVRFSASAINMQPLKFVIVDDEETKQKIFPNLKWAGYLKEWPGPNDKEKPAAYIILLGNRKKSPALDIDYGIAIQTILLSAAEKGYGGCPMGAVNRENLREILNIPTHLEIGIVIPIGKPGETAVIDDVKNNDIKYWRDNNSVQHVPKRTLDDLLDLNSEI
ncbi:MAG: nitroreductase [bacterium]|nr:nitroreductase [bacterium]